MTQHERAQFSPFLGKVVGLSPYFTLTPTLSLKGRGGTPCNEWRLQLQSQKRTDHPLAPLGRGGTPCNDWRLQLQPQKRTARPLAPSGRGGTPCNEWRLQLQSQKRTHHPLAPLGRGGTPCNEWRLQLQSQKRTDRPLALRVEEAHRAMIGDCSCSHKSARTIPSPLWGEGGTPCNEWRLQLQSQKRTDHPLAPLGRGLG